MKGALPCWIVFWTLIGMLVTGFLLARAHLLVIVNARFEVYPGIPLAALGIALIVLTVRIGAKRPQKGFWILTGAAAVGWPGSLLLHAFLYRFYPQEPFTYVMFFFVCPIGLVVGAIGTIVVGAIKRKKERGLLSRGV